MAELEERFGSAIVCKLIRGERGAFDVRVGTDLVFSKFQVGRFPAPGELLDAVAARLPG